jgi:pyrrolidone-carboxylate peptidase
MVTQLLRVSPAIFLGLPLLTIFIFFDLLSRPWRAGECLPHATKRYYLAGEKRDATFHLQVFHFVSDHAVFSVATITTDAIQHYHPNLVMSLGLNARSQAIRVEKIGVNLKRYLKNDGTWSFPRRIDVSGPLLRFSPLHTVDIVRKIREANISVQQSCFAGTYICNALFYQLLGYVSEQNSSRKVGFIHVPLLDSQNPQGMPLEAMVDAVKIAIEVSLG